MSTSRRPGPRRCRGQPADAGRGSPAGAGVRHAEGAGLAQHPDRQPGARGIPHHRHRWRAGRRRAARSWRAARPRCARCGPVRSASYFRRSIWCLRSTRGRTSRLPSSRRAHGWPNGAPRSRPRWTAWDSTGMHRIHRQARWRLAPAHRMPGMQPLQHHQVFRAPKRYGSNFLCVMDPLIRELVTHTNDCRLFAADSADS
jgi:hypothetical protein